MENALNLIMLNKVYINNRVYLRAFTVGYPGYVTVAVCNHVTVAILEVRWSVADAEVEEVRTRRSGTMDNLGTTSVPTHCGDLS